MGVSYAVERRFDDAERYLQKALAIDPNHARTKLALASVYASTARADKAKELLLQVSRSDPKNLRALDMLAGLESRGGDFAGAMAIYRKLGVTSRSAAVKEAGERGLID